MSAIFSQNRLVILLIASLTGVTLGLALVRPEFVPMAKDMNLMVIGGFLTLLNSNSRQDNHDGGVNVEKLEVNP